MMRAIEVVHAPLLDRALGRVLESMVFAGVERVEESGFPWADEHLVWARVDLIAPTVGDFWMLVPEGRSDGLADAAWGGEVAASNAVARALVAELVNAVAGQVLASLDEQSEVQIGIPRSGIGRVCSSDLAEVRHAFVLDDGTELGILVREAA